MAAGGFWLGLFAVALRLFYDERAQKEKLYITRMEGGVDVHLCGPGRVLGCDSPGYFFGLGTIWAVGLSQGMSLRRAAGSRGFPTFRQPLWFLVALLHRLQWRPKSAASQLTSAYFGGWEKKKAPLISY